MPSRAWDTVAAQRRFKRGGTLHLHIYYITLKSLFLFAGSRVVPGALEEGVCPEIGRAEALAEGDPGIGAVRLLYRGGVVL